MIELLELYGGWLFSEVPLWAFLVALLTTPTKWAARVNRAIDKYVGDDE